MSRFKLQVKDARLTCDQKKEGPPQLSDVADIIDEGTFEQILEMDDDDEREFSKGIVYGFFDQAKTTFEKMEKAV